MSKPGYGRTIPMTKSGFCQFGPDHTLCYFQDTCDCTCHEKVTEDVSS